jgi:hypothetical protein
MIVLLFSLANNGDDDNYQDESNGPSCSSCHHWHWDRTCNVLCSEELKIDKGIKFI